MNFQQEPNGLDENTFAKPVIWLVDYGGTTLLVSKYEVDR
jgi:hypothetical protein